MSGKGKEGNGVLSRKEDERGSEDQVNRAAFLLLFLTAAAIPPCSASSNCSSSTCGVAEDLPLLPEPAVLVLPPLGFLELEEAGVDRCVVAVEARDRVDFLRAGVIGSSSSSRDSSSSSSGRELIGESSLSIDSSVVLGSSIPASSASTTSFLFSFTSFSFSSSPFPFPLIEGGASGLSSLLSSF